MSKIYRFRFQYKFTWDRATYVYHVPGLPEARPSQTKKEYLMLISCSSSRCVDKALTPEMAFFLYLPFLFLFVHFSFPALLFLFLLCKQVLRKGSADLPIPLGTILLHFSYTFLFFSCLSTFPFLLFFFFLFWLRRLCEKARRTYRFLSAPFSFAFLIPSFSFPFYPLFLSCSSFSFSFG